jgi:ribokinase
VVGSINMDVVATAARHPKIGETVIGESLQYFPGGKGANQAVAAAKVDATVSMVGKLGNDTFADDLFEFLKAQQVDVSQVSRTKAPSGSAFITVAKDGDNSIIVFPGANDQLAPSDLHGLKFTETDVVLSQFETPTPTIEAAFRRAREAGATTVLNPAPAGLSPGRLLELTDVLVVNETELATLLGHRRLPEDIVEAARGLRSSNNQTVVVTLGSKGAVGVVEDQPVQIAGRKVYAVDTTGAGDCFVGTLAAELASGSSTADALQFANAAASLCVQRKGAGPSMPSRKDVEKALHS